MAERSANFFSPNQIPWTISLLLAAGTVVLYAQTFRFSFVNLDDQDYVYENPHVLDGLSWDNTRWAFTTSRSSNWHPLTWLSLMLDVELFGADPGRMHMTNALLHTASTVLLFWMLLRMTGMVWPSAWVAAMFAWHPLHVESVTWISERKDVLSALFMMLALLAYERYVRRPSWRPYICTLALLALGLMSKPMLVTFPFVLLLLDFWPLRRMAGWRSSLKLVVEKLPMLALVAASSVVTVLVQSAGKSVAGVEQLPIGFRLANAVVAYGIYLWQTILPKGLAILYPLATLIPGRQIPGWQIAVSAVLLVAVTVVALVLRKRHPWLLVGWLWYLGTLVPVIGLIQVGNQAHADRYTYIPLIGIFVAVAWLASAMVKRGRWARLVVIACALGTTLGATLLSWRQIRYWRNSYTVMKRAVDLMPDNYLARTCLGQALDEMGNHAAAAEQYRAALRIRPDDAMALNNLGVQAAAAHRLEEAINLYRQALSVDRNYLPAYLNYGNALMRLDRRNEAIRIYRAAIELDPAFYPGYHALALALAAGGELHEAIALWERALKIHPGFNDAHSSLGAALLMTGQTELGMSHLRRSLEVEPADVATLTRLAWVLATHPDPRHRDAGQAERLARRAVELTDGKDPIALDTLAAALARNGQYDQAVDAATRAQQLAAQQDSSLVQQIGGRIEMYRAQQPYTSKR